MRSWAGVLLRSPAAIVMVPAGAGGLATLLEKKSRRMELAIYCLSRALESFALCLVDWGLVRRRQAHSLSGACDRSGLLMVLLMLICT